MFENRHKKLADQLKGSMSYKDHYAYLLDWYSRDRSGLATAMPAGEPNKAVVEDHVKESLNDVLEALKHLDSKVECINKGNPEVRKVKPKRKGVAGNLFTRLVDRRRVNVSPRAC